MILRLLAIASLVLALSNLDAGSSMDPNGGSAGTDSRGGMDPNGASLNDGPGIDPDGGGAMDPNG